MLGIEDYGSDVESGDEGPPPLPPPKSSSLVLPPPSSKQKRTKKIAISRPSLPPDDDADDSPPAKKPRVALGTSAAGKSALLNLLPPPKRPAPVIEKKEERVLGGGGSPGLVFRASKRTALRHDPDGPASTAVPPVDAEEDGQTVVSAPSFLPPSLQKGRANVSLETEGPARRRKSATPPIDFFSLSSTPAPAPTPTPSSAPSTSISAPPSSLFAVSSAPAISTFRPPSPTLDDPYPGYYLLPSGAYAPYDTDYYASYAQKWQAAYDKHIRALEKSQYEPETDGARDVDMAAEMEEARRKIKEREDKKALTAGKSGLNEDGEPAMPKMNVKGAKLGAVARTRHQLTTLLTEAYMNREALEERIAQGRRNRKEAGNKYGF